LPVFFKIEKSKEILISLKMQLSQHGPICLLYKPLEIDEMAPIYEEPEKLVADKDQ
jgi:hypothetical protein